MKKQEEQGEFACNQDAGRLINIVSHQLKRSLLLSTQKDCGLTNMQNRALHFVLMRYPHIPTYQKDMEKEFHIRKSTATEILKLMEKNGFIYRKSSQIDARMKEIMPTEKALNVKKQVMDNIRVVEEKLRKNIAEEDFSICMQVLKQMAENLAEREDGEEK